MFYDLLYSNESTNLEFSEDGGSKSKGNKDEAEFIVKLVASVIEILAKDGVRDNNFDRAYDKIGIITPYK